MKKEDKNLERRKEILAEIEELDRKISSEDFCMEYYDRRMELNDELWSLLPRETELNRFRREMYQFCSDGAMKFMIGLALISGFFLGGIAGIIYSVLAGSFFLWVFAYPKDDGII